MKDSPSARYRPRSAVNTEDTMMTTKPCLRTADGLAADHRGRGNLRWLRPRISHSRRQREPGPQSPKPSLPRARIHIKLSRVANEAKATLPSRNEAVAPPDTWPACRKQPFGRGGRTSRRARRRPTPSCRLWLSQKRQHPPAARPSIQ